MKKKFKVMGDSKNTFMNIELDMVIDNEEIGEIINVLGGAFTITQNGKILVLADKDWVLTLMDITSPVEIEVEKLEINKNVDMFFETKEVRVQIDCTYVELYEILNAEWKMAGALVGKPSPFEYNTELKLFTFLDEWNFEKGSMPHLRDGSFSRKTFYGTNI